MSHVLLCHNMFFWFFYTSCIAAVRFNSQGVYNTHRRKSLDWINSLFPRTSHCAAQCQGWPGLSYGTGGIEKGQCLIPLLYYYITALPDADTTGRAGAVSIRLQPKKRQQQGNLVAQIRLQNIQDAEQNTMIFEN